MGSDEAVHPAVVRRALRELVRPAVAAYARHARERQRWVPALPDLVALVGPPADLAALAVPELGVSIDHTAGTVCCVVPRTRLRQAVRGADGASLADAVDAQAPEDFVMVWVTAERVDVFPFHDVADGGPG